MSVVRFTVMMPTIGRPTLARSIQSFIDNQDVQTPDQLLVLPDANREEWVGPGWVFGREHDIRMVEVHPHDGGYSWLGVPQLNWALQSGLVKGTHVMLLGDDDMYVKGAFDRLRPVCAANPNRPILFRFVSPWRAVLWDQPRLQISRISGCCIAAPIQYVGLHPTGRTVEHDYWWICDIVNKAAEAGYEPLWLDEVLVVARPDASTDAQWP